MLKRTVLTNWLLMNDSVKGYLFQILTPKYGRVVLRAWDGGGRSG